MEAWKNLKSGKEMAEVCQLPDSILTALTTEALVKTCLDYPLLLEVFYANDLPTGINAVIQNFNGLRELIKRSDAATVLLEMYTIKKITDVTNKKTDIEQGAFAVSFVYLELLLSRPVLISKLSHNEKVSLVKDAINKYDEKKLQPKVFSELSQTPSLLIVGQALSAENKFDSTNKKVINTFLLTGRFTDPSVITSLYNAGRSMQ